MLGKIHSFETMGTVDGPGIRFVIFMQGCPLRCKFCHNPDTWSTLGGKLYSADECVSMILKYKNYIANGGVTITGGEPLLQIDFITELFSKLKDLNIHTCLDTSGITFEKSNLELLKKFDKLMSVTNLVLLDIKHIDNEAHKNLTGASNKNVLDFANYLNEKNIPVWIRCVIIPTINSSKEILLKTSNFINSLTNVQKVEILPYHNMAIEKYKKMEIKYPFENIQLPNEREINLAKDILKLKK